MGWKITLSLFFIFFSIFLLVVYWFFPLSSNDFIEQFRPNSPIIQAGQFSSVQFYNNMRFPESTITYNIGDCPIAKRDEAIRAFDLLENKTLLTFYPVATDEDISIICDSKVRIEGGMFIAGEGGPTNITKAGEFNVITKGTVFLFKESKCANPNVALHEILHVLGFNHTNNEQDIMYPISSCDQEMTDQMIEMINVLYSIPSYQDLTFEEVSATMRGKYLDSNISLRNIGLKKSIPAKIEIYADENLVKEVDLDYLEIGHGRIITLKNIWVNQFSVQNLKFVISTDANELRKENNEVILKVKNN